MKVAPRNRGLRKLRATDLQPHPNLSVTGQGFLSVLDSLLQPFGQPLLDLAEQLQLTGGQGTSQVAIGGQGTFLAVDAPKNAPLHFPGPLNFAPG